MDGISQHLIFVMDGINQLLFFSIEEKIGRHLFLLDGISHQLLFSQGIEIANTYFFH